jgi:hypothetical protein
MDKPPKLAQTKNGAVDVPPKPVRTKSEALELLFFIPRAVSPILSKIFSPADWHLQINLFYKFQYY